MKFFQDRELSAGLWVMILIFVLPLPTSAQTFRIQTDTVAQASQFVRADLNTVARRALSQRVGLWGYDLIGDRTGRLSTHIAFHYFNDFALTDAERIRRTTRLRSDRLSLDAAYIKWIPYPKIVIVGGRLTTFDGFALSDIDGGEFQFRPSLGKEVKAHLQGYLGRDVVGEFETFNPDRYDLQGLPINTDDEPISDGITFGGRGTMSVTDNTISIAYKRRQYDDNGATRIGSERIAFGAAGTLFNDVNIAANVSYHTLKEDIDNGLFDLAWRVFDSPVVLSAGFQHRKPVFDSSSIFNLFGDSTRQSIYTAAQYQTSSDLTLKVNGWWRQYPDDQTIIDDLDVDDQTVGSSATMNARFDAFGRPFQMSGLVSGQWSNVYGNQYVVDHSLRFPLFDRNIRALHRVTLIGATNDLTTRHGDRLSLALTYGVEHDLNFGEVSAAAAIVSNGSEPTHLNMFMTFSTEIWP